MRAQALAGEGDYQGAASVAAAIIGFDLKSKKAAKTLPSNRFARQASLLLASLLDEKLRDKEAAERVLQQLVTMDPNDFRVWLAVANWHWTHKEFSQAAIDVAKAASIAPDDPDVLFTNIEIALAQKRLDAAEKLVFQARGMFPGDERVYRGLAAVSMQQGNPNKAVDDLREGLGLRPDEASLLLMLADILIQQNRIPEAEETIARFVKKQDGTSPAAGLMEARLLIAQQRWLPAKQKLEAVRPLVAASDSLMKQVDLCIAQCHEQLGEFDEQLAANRRVLSEDHTSVAAQIGIAGALAAAGKQDEALAEFETIAAALPANLLEKTPQIWNPLLQLRAVEQMKRPAAERDWTKVDQLLDAVEQSATVADAQVALLRCDILVRKGDAAAAMALLQQTVDTNPTVPQPLTALVLLTLREDGPAAARSLIDKAPPELAADPAMLLVQAQLAAREPTDEATAHFGQIETQADALPAVQASRVLSVIGSIRRAMGERRDAERLWKSALKKTPDDLRIRTSLFELACEEGDVEQARLAADEIGRLAGPTSPQGRVSHAAALILDARVQQARQASLIGPAGPGTTMPALTPAVDEQLVAAKTLLLEAENIRPGWSQIQQLLAEIASLRGDIPTAIDRLQQATQRGPANPKVIRQLVSLLYLSNRLDEAQQSLAQLGSDGLVGFDRLSVEMELSAGKFDEAVASAERGLASQSQPTAADLLWFGQVLVRGGQAERAGEILRQAVEADPTRAEAWLALFSQKVTTGQRRAAEQTLEKALENLSVPQRQLVAAHGYETLGRIEDAEQNLREAIAEVPDNAAVTRSLASFLVRRGRLAAAREQLQAIIAGSEADSASKAARHWARRSLAELIAGTGEYRDVERALAIIDENADSEKTLTADDLLLKIGILANRPEPRSWRRAISLLDELSALQPLSAIQRLQRAQLMDKAGRWEECRNELVSLASAVNSPSIAQSILVDKLIRHSELAAAATWLKKLTALTPEAPSVFELQARLSLAENDRPAAVAAARRLVPEDAGEPPTEGLARQLFSAATLMEEMGFSKAADGIFSRLAAISSEGVVTRAAFLGREQRGDESLDLLEKSKSDIPSEKLLRSAVSMLRSQREGGSLQQRERVEQWFAKARREDPGAVSLAMLEADLKSHAGSHDDVVAIYRTILARQDLTAMQSAVVANNLAFHLARPETAAEAETLVQKAIEELGPHPDVLDTRGIVLLASGKTAEAVEVLQEAVLEPSAIKYLHLASALIAHKQIEAAKLALAQAHKLGLDRRTLDGDDAERLNAVEAVIGS